MTNKQFKNLHQGDIVKHKHSSTLYLVDRNYGDRVTAMTSIDLTNPLEWEIILESNYTQPK